MPYPTAKDFLTYVRYRHVVKFKRLEAPHVSGLLRVLLPHRRLAGLGHVLPLVLLALRSKPSHDPP